MNNTLAREELLASLRWNKFPVLDKGFICLVDCMGDDASVVQAARVSYGVGTKKVSDDEALIRYLYRHSHTTPFEMAELKFLVRVPMDTWRQWIRHRTASVNEYSTRYSEAIDACQRTEAKGWRSQSETNKQGSGGAIEEWPEGYEFDSENGVLLRPFAVGKEIVNLDPGDNGGGPKTPAEYLSYREWDLQWRVREVYKERLAFGVAREQARKDLPLSTYTEAYWKIDLLNLLRFLSLRMDSHAQLEIRQFATTIGEQIVAPLFPLCWQAFNDYDHRRGALMLSALDVKVINNLNGFMPPVDRNSFLNAVEWAKVGWPGLNEGRCREQEECWEKLKRLGLAKE